MIDDVTDKQFSKFSEMIRNAIGVNLGNHKKELLKNRLRKRLNALGLSSYKDYYDYLMKHDEEGRELENMSTVITTNVTSFFREADHFDYLKDVFLPSLVEARSAGNRKKLRAWSAGCSSGEEPYTMAITLNEYFEDRSDFDVKILATDVSTKVLEEAKRGVYKEKAIGGLDKAVVRANFMKGTGDQRGYVKVKEHVRRMVTVAHLNFMDESYPFKGPFDVIFCRNVLIYFDKKTQTRLISKFHDYLADDGRLFLGHSEGLAGGHPGFKYVAPAVYKKV